MKKILILIIALVLLSNLVLAQSGHMTLLTVAETEDSTIGGTADLYLEIRQGTGSIYIDSFPLTKLDTQISTRSANRIACELARMDCSKYDFFYVIRAKSTIVGGPSAGAAITVLTYSLLKNIPLDPSTAITGSISSGGLIGPVGGIKSKIIAAYNAGIEKVIIPNLELDMNQTENITKLAEELNITLYRFTKIEDAIEEFTGKDIEKFSGEIEPPYEYQKTMRNIALELCKRSFELNEEIEEKNNITNEGINFYNEARNAMSQNKFYPAASLCFSSNVKFTEAFLKNKTNDELLIFHNRLVSQLEKFDENISSREIQTITDLESFMIVKERLTEAKELISRFNTSNLSPTELAYAIERFHSGIAWSAFYGKGTKKFVLNKESLRESCIKKLSEAEETINYISLYIPAELSDIRNELALANIDLNYENYELCLFKASKAKAEANMISSVLLISESQLSDVIEEKLDAARKVIAYEQTKDIFPVLGYSYSEYGDYLKENKTVSSLLYVEYALELSNLDVYFKKAETNNKPQIDYEKVVVLILGIVIGSLTTLIILDHKKKRDKLKVEYKTDKLFDKLGRRRKIKKKK